MYHSKLQLLTREDVPNLDLAWLCLSQVRLQYDHTLHLSDSICSDITAVLIFTD